MRAKALLFLCLVFLIPAAGCSQHHAAPEGMRSSCGCACKKHCRKAKMQGESCGMAEEMKGDKMSCGSCGKTSACGKRGEMDSESSM